MARIQKTPRYPIGTRVLKYFTGYKDPFEGTVDRIMPESGFYHILYEDGDSEEMTEDDVETHFHALPRKKRALNLVSTTTPSKTRKVQEIADNQDGDKDVVSDHDDDEDANGGNAIDDVNKLVGRRICKTEVDAMGKESTLSGTVLSYFPATKMYRVLYFNGMCDDMTYQEVLDSVPLASPEVVRSKKRKLAVGHDQTKTPQPSASPKKPKTFDSATKKSTSRSDENRNDENRLEHTVMRDNDSTLEAQPAQSFVLNQNNAYTIVRNTLFIIASNSAVTCETKDLQMDVLRNGDIKPKKALEQFVEHGGLKSLQQLLNLWVQSKETEPGVLLILKVLAVIPGVTAKSVIDSNIGRKLRDIDKGRVEGITDPDPSMKDMARWIIKKWKDELQDKSSTKTSNKNKSTDKSKEKAEAKREEENSSKTTSETSTPTTPVKSSVEKAKLGATKIKSNSVSHLRDLMGVARPSIARRSGDLLGSALGVRGSRPLGHAHKARRSTVLLDAISDRKSKNEQAEKVKASTQSIPREDEWIPSRVRFGETKRLEFLKDHEVAKLLVFAGSKHHTHHPHHTHREHRHCPDRRPSRSILRVRLDPSEIVRSVVPSTDEINDNGSSETGDAIPDVSSFHALVSIEATMESARNESETSSREDTVEDEPMVPPPPPSPPRPRDISVEDDADIPMDIEIDDTTTPPTPVESGEASSETASEDRGDNSVEDTTPVTSSAPSMSPASGSASPLPATQPPASPVPSPSPERPSSPESGEVTDDGVTDINDTPTIPHPDQVASLTPPEPHQSILLADQRPDDASM